MKVKIIKKTIKEGVSASGAAYCIKSLFVSFTDSAIYQSIVARLKKDGCTDAEIEKFCKPNDYNGSISYAFGLNCSNYTFDIVSQFGVLDAKIDIKKNEKGYIGAKIAVVDRKEQVNSYESPDDEVIGWAGMNAPAPKLIQQTQSIAEQMGVANVQPKSLDLAAGNPADDLPF